jgi:hypothetical protein
MREDDELIPSPPIIRAELAKNIRKGRLLRALYRLSLRAVEERGASTIGREQSRFSAQTLTEQRTAP